MQNILTANRWAFGDSVLITAIPRDLALAYPGQYQVFVQGHYTSLWRNSPYATIGPAPPGAVRWSPHYIDGIKASNQGERVHFLAWLHRDFEKQTGIRLPTLLPKGDLHFGPEEEEPLPGLPDRYWLIVAGGKLSMTAKVWRGRRWQELVEALARHGIPCVQAGAFHNRHFQPRLAGCVDYLGKTEDINDLCRLVRDADGAICGVTGVMHAAAALDRPCVVLGGGREDWWWEGYFPSEPNPFGQECSAIKVPHRFLHTIGDLECCRERGCWRDLTVPLEAADLGVKKNKVCLDALHVGGEPVPRCLEQISVDQVLRAVLSYYDDGTLEPIGPTTKEFSLAADLQLAEAPPPAVADPHAILDHPLLGGKLTVGIVGYGDYPHLMERLLESLWRTVPPARLDIRIALNQVSQATVEVIDRFPATWISFVDSSEENRFKYPAMRTLIYEGPPITSEYLIWFDDDCHCVRDHWLIALAEKIIANPQGGIFGIPFLHNFAHYRTPAHDPVEWFKKGKWWRDKPFFNRRGQEDPQGTCIKFVSGGFWAAPMAAIRAAGVPDERLLNNGGDATIGEMIHQQGYSIVEFNKDKTHVFSSGHPRRGVTHPFPWIQPAAQ